MKEWHMVHNIADGLPVEAVTTMDTLRKAVLPDYLWAFAWSP